MAEWTLVGLRRASLGTGQVGGQFGLLMRDHGHAVAAQTLEELSQQEAARERRRPPYDSSQTQPEPHALFDFFELGR